MIRQVPGKKCCLSRGRRYHTLWKKLREGGERPPSPSKAQGRNPNHRPPGFRASCATLTRACPNLMSGRQRYCLSLILRHRVLHPKPLPQPDGAPLCPVAYPSLVSFLVTATTGGGAYSPTNDKCRAPADPCQELYRFSFQTRQVPLSAHLSVSFKRPLLSAQPPMGKSNRCWKYLKQEHASQASSLSYRRIQ